jgi:formylmethanofuran dehydrogenase subunit E
MPIEEIEEPIECSYCREMFDPEDTTIRHEERFGVVCRSCADEIDEGDPDEEWEDEE